jgi:hypothetical protein
MPATDALATASTGAAKSAQLERLLNDQRRCTRLSFRSRFSCGGVRLMCCFGSIPPLTVDTSGT